MTEQEVKKIIDAMNQVKPVQFVPVFGGMTNRMAADYFEVSIYTIYSYANHKEVKGNRFYVPSRELTEAGFSIHSVKKNGQYYGLVATKGSFTTTFSTSGDMLLLNETMVAYLAKHLKSKVAEKVRKIVNSDLDAQENKTTMLPVKTNESIKNIEPVRVFTTEKFGNVRAIVRDGEPWFVATDVCKALCINNSRMAVDKLDEDEKNTVSLTDGNRGNPNTTIINEPGLYALTLSSRKPEAKAFKRWITHEVIPAIHRQGAYITPKVADDILMNPDFLIQLAERRKQEIAQMDKLRASLEQITTEAAQYKDELQRANDSVKELTATNAALSEAVDQNKATTEELNRTVADLTAAKSENDSLTEKLAATKQSKKKLEDKVNAYECRDMILALIRAYSYAACGGLKQEANDDFQRELFARHGIDLEPRIKYFGAGRSVIDYLRTDEYDKAANMMISMCKQRGINTAKILNVSRPGELFERKTA